MKLLKPKFNFFPIFLIVVSVIFSSCNFGNDGKSENVFGMYRTKNAKEYVRLNSDSTYGHGKNVNGVDSVSKGKWTFEIRKDESDRIILDGWEGGMASFPFYNNQIHVMPDDDTNDFYKSEKD